MSIRSQAHAALQRDGAVALVTVASVQGSAPREAGASMLVTARGFYGSIGGGTLEWKAMAQAQNLLSHGQDKHSATYALGPDMGQCCGGRVTLITQVFRSGDAAQLDDALGTDVPPRHLCLFGAGHVGRALVLALAQCDFAIDWVDPRPEAFPAAVPGTVTLHGGENVLEPLAKLAAGSLVLVMSHSHALDFEVTDAALRMSHVANVLLIGSATKRARFLRRLTDAGHGPENLARLICPIGLGGIRSKAPQAIAISTAAQLLALDESLAVAQHPAEAAPIAACTGFA